MLREQRLYSRTASDSLRALADREINYQLRGHAPTHAAGWHIDTLHYPLAQERAGDIEAGGAWEIACRLVHDYQFAEPGIVRALYCRGEPLLGRNMLLEGRFAGLRFDMGVRVTRVVDENRGESDTAQRVWGWAYQTLSGHLEEGELTYEIVKHLHSGAVEFCISGYSRRAAIPNPIVRLGFTLFGRITQQRFYRACGKRLRVLVHAELHGGPPLTPESATGDDTTVIAPARAASDNLGRPAHL